MYSTAREETFNVGFKFENLLVKQLRGILTLNFEFELVGIFVSFFFVDFQIPHMTIGLVVNFEQKLMTRFRGMLDLGLVIQIPRAVEVSVWCELCDFGTVV